MPWRISSIAKSTSMMAFLVTMPISIRMPMTTGMAERLAGESQADDGAADRQRQREQDGDRLQEAAEQQDEHRVDHHQAGAHGVAKPSNTSSMISASPAAWMLTPARHVLAAGSARRVEAFAERGVAGAGRRSITTRRSRS